MLEHLGVVESSAFGWLAMCLVCGHSVTDRLPELASRALVDLCASASTRTLQAVYAS